MKKYFFRKNFSASFSNQDLVVKGKIAFKTKETHWLNTNVPVIIPISIHSAFHEGHDGELKMNAFISTIKKLVKGKITILFTEKAHVQVASLKHQNNFKKAFEECFTHAQVLTNRFKTYFEGCNVAYWHSYINEDPNYPIYCSQIQNLYQNDPLFRCHLLEDAKSTYTPERAKAFPNKKQFISLSINDLIEQCAGLLAIINKGYSFQFYPGSDLASTNYVNRTLVPLDKQIFYIDVFLTIEKKSIIKKRPLLIV